MIKKNLQLLISALVVVGAALFYGASPGNLLPFLFDFDTQNTDLRNILRAVMGLYLAFSGFWIYALYRPAYWRTATLSNALFMGGLGFGRLISFILDGYSEVYFPGMLLEFGMMAWALFNLKKA
ncbi:DUF4345 domain-containing protein [Aureicoccus marinus]|uniref:DUF4345 domain-containing protein n=1 Tax=Aureicoccus marinus TaxID=754435 RepID=A0A2S7T8V0_9FLAO|nr:DUF4345 domain-containing protein [Aureicoccus marinus]PQJ15998.1 hypothetical protein BST99_09925 [Aureicoccus marinus]